MRELDNTDRKILQALQYDARLTAKELGAAVNLSSSPAHDRQKRLEQEGFIKKYVAIVDAKKVGNGFIVFCNIRLKHHSRAYGMEFMQVINGLDEVTECYNTSGDYDFMAKIYVRDMAHYQDFVLNKLGDIDCIGSLHSTFVIGEVKHTHAVPIAATGQQE